MLAEAKNLGILSRIEVDTIIRRLWYFIKHYKTMDEINLSIKMMKCYLTHEDCQKIHLGEISRLTRNKIHESSYMVGNFLNTKFQE